LRTAAIMAEGSPQIELEDLPEDFLLDCEESAESVDRRQLKHDAAPAREMAGEAAFAASTSASATSAPARMEDWQATLIAQTLDRHSGNVSATARELGLARNTVYRYLRRGHAQI
jgi:transcriptional regulator of acetoin/glycerol metabolism